MTTVSISQPTYLPWAGYFDLISRSDHFVFLDDVQLERQSWQTRNRLRDKSGAIIWLSIPVSKAPLSTIIRDIKIAPNPPTWRTKHLRSIQSCLSKAQYFSQISDLVDSIFSGPILTLAEHNMSIIKAISSHLGLQTQFHTSSSFGIIGNRDDRLISICDHIGASKYYSNNGSRSYLLASSDLFLANQISLVFQDWHHPVYSQGSLSFLSHLSVLDTIAYMGTEQFSEYLSR